MNEAKKQKLEQLLTDARDALQTQIKDARSKNIVSVSMERYIEWVKLAWYRHYELSDLSRYTSEIDIKSQTTKSAILDIIRDEYAPFICDDRIQTAFNYVGGPYYDEGYPLTEVLTQLLRIAIVHDIKKAVSDFDRYAKENCVRVKDVALLEGIRIETPVQVDDGIQLIPLPDSTSNLSGHFAPFVYPFSHLPLHHFCSKTLLVVDYSVCPAFLRPRDKSTTEQEYFKRIMHSRQTHVASVVEKLSQALSLACNQAIGFSVMWKQWPRNELFCLGPVELSAVITSVMNSAELSLFRVSNMFSNTDVDEAQRLYKCFKNRSLSENLRTPIQRWISSKGAANLNLIDSIIDVGIALETLYLSKSESSGEISFRLSVRAAWHLGQDVEDRKRLQDTLKKIYDRRSKAVHNGTLDEEIQCGGKRILISEFIELAQDLCRKSIFKIFKDGRIPDWNSLILGGEE